MKLIAKNLLAGTLLFGLMGCNTETILEVEVIKEVEVKSPLKFSGTALFALRADGNPWNKEAGIVLFVKAFNTGDSTWYGYSEVNTYSVIEGQKTPGDLISIGQGIMTSRVNPFGSPIPADTLANEIPASELRTTLTFAPVVWSENLNGVWVYWSFVKDTLAIENSLAKRTVQREDFIYIAKPRR